MSGRYLLDTTTAIAVLESQVDLESRRNRGIEVFLCLTVVGELFFGAEKSQRVEANRKRVEGLVGACPVLPHNLETTRHYAVIKATLRKKGRPIPENDLWIAAAARQYGLTLVTRDGHFNEVTDLVTEAW